MSNARPLSVLLLLLICPLAVHAYEVASPDPDPRPVPNGRMLAVGPLEAEFAKLEATVPGFAGWHIDADGRAVVSLKDVQRREEAFARLAPFVEARRDSRGRGAAANPLQFEARQANYSFLELAAFRNALYGRFPGGIRRVDVDEVRNVLALGVHEAADVVRVRAAVARLGIPANAVSVEVVPPVQPRVTLSDRHRPIRGGSQFVFRTGNNVLSSCTVGMNGVYFNSSSYAGFVTASHCTQSSWTYTGNSAGQPTTAQADLVAAEYDDPDYTFAICPGVTPENGYAAAIGCRWSDSAFYRYLEPVRSTAWGGATIHTTEYASYAQVGSIVINGSLPVTGDAPASVVGTILYKMGAATGATYGQVTQTCSDQWGAPPPLDPTKGVFLLCQDGSDLYNESGDSGGPVYRKFDTYAQWAGILWGADSHTTWHSPAWNVRQDLPNFSY